MSRDGTQLPSVFAKDTPWLLSGSLVCHVVLGEGHLGSGLSHCHGGRQPDPGLATFCVQQPLSVLASHFSATRAGAGTPWASLVWGLRQCGVGRSPACLFPEKENWPRVASEPGAPSAPLSTVPCVWLSCGFPSVFGIHPSLPSPGSLLSHLLSASETAPNCFPAGEGHTRESSPIINNGDMENESFFEGKNMALFEVRYTLSCREQGQYSSCNVDN